MGEIVVRPHSPISGSKIKRFLKCPTSFYKTDNDMIDTNPKTAAIEGERAHDLAEKTFWEGSSALDGVRNKMMINGAMIYAQTIRAEAIRDCEVRTEGFLYMGDNFGFDKDYIGGYFDACWFSRAKRVCHMFDYKFGIHVVEPDTPQLTFYILAQLLVDARENFGELPVWEDEILSYLDNFKQWSFRQTIVQPKRKDGVVHTHELPFSNLKQFVRDMCRSVAIYQDTGKFDDKTCESNPDCKYCEKRLFCKKAPAMAEASSFAFKFDKKE